MLKSLYADAPINAIHIGKWTYKYRVEKNWSNWAPFPSSHAKHWYLT
jgi:hypothetical protein